MDLGIKFSTLLIGAVVFLNISRSDFKHLFSARNSRNSC